MKMILEEQIGEHWRLIGVNKTEFQNTTDMNAYYGGFSTAFMPVGYTLPAIYVRGLIGAYHDWCVPFSTYPRSYDLLHGFHLFSRYKGYVEGYDIENIMLEMDHIICPQGLL